MSAKQTYSKPILTLPLLPAEIWSLILRYATFVPHTFSPELTTYRFSNSSLKDQTKSIRAALVTKRYVVRVCKGWFSLASPFLYEHIVLSKYKRVSALLPALVRSHQANQSDADVCPCGWWTKRLDIRMRDNGEEHHDKNLEALAALIRELPNLSIVTFGVTAHHFRGLSLPEPVVRALAACSAMRVVNWYNCLLFPTRAGWLFLLSSWESVQAINVGIRYSGIIPNSEIASTLCHLASLTTLYICPSDIQILGYLPVDMPSLSHLQFDLVDNVVPKYHCRPLIEIYGNNLLSVGICYDSRIYIYSILPMLSKHCPNLIRLDIATTAWFKLSKYRIPSSVKCLSLRSIILQEDDTGYANLSMFLQYLAASCTTVRTLIFSDRRNVVELKKHRRILRGGIESAKASGMDLQDSEGYPLDLE